MFTESFSTSLLFITKTKIKRGREGDRERREGEREREILETQLLKIDLYILITRLAPISWRPQMEASTPLDQRLSRPSNLDGVTKTIDHRIIDV